MRHKSVYVSKLDPKLKKPRLSVKQAIAIVRRGMPVPFPPGEFQSFLHEVKKDLKNHFCDSCEL